MAQNGVDGVWDAFYRPFLDGGRIAIADRDIQAVTETMLQRTLLELCMNRFEWEGLPDEISVRWLEQSLTYNALSVFYYDDTFGKYFALRGAGTGNLNLVGDPTEFKVYGNQFYTKDLKATECVPIWANKMRYPDWDKIEIYARKIAMMQRTVEINAITARRTKVMRVAEKSKLSAENINADLDTGTAVLKVLPEVALQEMFDVIDLGTDAASIINMDILADRQWAKILNLMGINTANQDKKERLVAAEVSGNNDEVTTIRNTMLQARETACDQINAMYPELNVSVKWASELETPELKDMTNEDTTDTDGR